MLPKPLTNSTNSTSSVLSDLISRMMCSFTWRSTSLITLNSTSVNTVSTILGYNKIGGEGITALSLANPSIKKLILSNNLLDDKDIHALSKFPNLIELDLSTPYILPYRQQQNRRYGRHHNLHPPPPPLNPLPLYPPLVISENNHITSAGAEHLLDKLTNTREIYLSHNEIREDFKQKHKGKMNVIF